MTKKRTAVTATVFAVLTVVTISSCSSATTDSGGELVSGGTFVKAITSDPGSLIPMTAIAPDAREMVNYAYESMVYATPDGDLIPWLAESWEETGSQISYTLRSGITCSDGTPFTADVAANNINYQANPENATFYYGSQITEALSATADGDVLTITSTDNNPFLLANTGIVEMVCQSGLDDPDSLIDSTDGTGLYVLSDVAVQSSYTFTKRDDYQWGPNDVTSETTGLPDSLEIRVISDESTATNLLLSGDINAAAVIGSDKSRLDSAGLDSVGVRVPTGEMLFNERIDRPTSDPLVREALVTAINREEVGSVVTDGSGIPAISLVTKSPLLCVATTAAWSLPETDLSKAGDLLDEAGWTLSDDGLRYKDGIPLTIKFIYDAGTSTHAPAAELVQQTWDELGITTDLQSMDAAAWSEQLFQTFDWDTGFIQIAGGSPVFFSNFFAGANPEDGGSNFMFVENPDYTALASQAASASPEEACGLWQEAETALIERTDVFPMIDNIVPTYVSGAVFDMPDYVTPTSIRMLG